MKRVLCIWFPNWPIQRIVVAHPELKGRPVVLYSQSGQRGAVVVRCSRAAARRGIRPGMPVAEAEGLAGTVENRGLKIEDRGWKAEGTASVIHPPSSILDPRSNNATHHSPLTTFPSDPAGDREALRALAHRCRRYSPIVGLEEAEAPECLLLDITGCAHLFGGEGELIEQVRRDFQRWGYHVRAAATETIGEAWALAHYGGERRAEGGGPERMQIEDRGSKIGDRPEDIHSPSSILHPQFQTTHHSSLTTHSLPVEALRLPGEVLALLHEFDLGTIGQVRALPRESLPSRFGESLLQRLDQLLGFLPEMIVPEPMPEPVEAWWSSEERIENRLAVEAVFKRLLDEILQRLRSRREGILQLECELGRGQIPSLQFIVDLARPTLSRRHLRELIRLQLERAIGGQQISAPEGRQTVAHGVSRGERVHPSRPAPAGAKDDPRSVSAAPAGAPENAESGFSRISLRATVIAALNSRQHEIFENGQEHERAGELAVLINRLSGRLGRPAVLRPWSVPDAQPECAVRYRLALPAAGRRRSENRKGRNGFWESPLSQRSDHPFGPSERRLPTVFTRPLQLRSQPVAVEAIAPYPEGPPSRFWWEGREYAVARAQGPERIETGWWRQEDVRRDYYRVETTSGERFWLFRDRRDGGWFMQGCFG